MSLDLHDCSLSGPSLTPPFLRDGLAVPPSPLAGWDSLRRSLCRGTAQRVHLGITAPLARMLGYDQIRRQPTVTTREGEEDGGWLLAAGDVVLRAWTTGSETDLDASDRRSMTRGAQRVLLAKRELAGLQTNGDVLRLLLCDPVRSDTILSIPIDGWPRLAEAPDSLRVLAALISAHTLSKLPQVLDAARLHQTRVTVALRAQARDAIVGFINHLPTRGAASAAELWREGLVLVYRLLFILKLESSSGVEPGFSFASSELWRSALSPNRALAPLVRRHLDGGHDTGRMLEGGLRSLFRACQDGLACSELCLSALGGALFGEGSTPWLDRLEWGDRAVAILLDRLIWTSGKTHARVHYGSLDVEDLGSIYEGLLELEPAFLPEPASQAIAAPSLAPDGRHDGQTEVFHLRGGAGRKATGSFYTPREFVRFLVRETLEPKVNALSPQDDPRPASLLTLKVVDPAMGSGHFLVEACRYLGEAVLQACLAADAKGLQDRIDALPDPDGTIAPYLPSRGYDEVRARAICRRLVAVHCLYGCDRNPLAVELAKLSLWLESWAEGLPLTFLDHRLVTGNALSGPSFVSLLTLPVTGGPLDPLLARGVAERLEQRRDEAVRLIRSLDASIGRDTADLSAKRLVKQDLDRRLAPLLRLASAWTASVVTGSRDADDRWLATASQVAATGDWPGGCGLPDNDPVCWDLVFPEVFPDGFDIVLGNPPWDAVQPNTKDFVANHDPAVLDARTVWDRSRIEASVLQRPGVAEAFMRYQQGFEETKRIARRLYPLQRGAAGNLDLFRLFAERALQLVRKDGAIGMVLPSAFHASASAAPIRAAYLDQTKLSWCLSFENRSKLFDIDSRFKFALVVAQRPGPTAVLRCGFYLNRMEEIRDPDRILLYSRAFLKSAGGESLMPLELRRSADLHVAERLYANPERLGAWCAKRGIRFGCDLHMTADSGCFLPPGSGELPVHEGKTFHQYTGQWDAQPRYSVMAGALKPAVTEASRHPRLAFRDIARATDERTMIAFLAPDGVVFGHTATVERSPWTRSLDDALLLCAVFNSFTFDWLARLRTATHLSLYLLDGLPMPSLTPEQSSFLVGAARHLSTGAQAPATRAEVDALVARAYGLDREDYAQVLSGFSHRSDPQAAERCLLAFDAHDMSMEDARLSSAPVARPASSVHSHRRRAEVR